MPNTTVDYWDVDGVSLNDYVRGLNSWGGSREAPPPMRGSNQVIPYEYGERRVRKVPGARSMSLEGWITAERAGIENEANLKQNWRELRSLLWRPDEEFPLTRRWRDAAGASKVATGRAEFVGGMEPDISNLTLRFAVDLNMPDPFFYAPEITLPVLTAYVNINEHGDFPTKKMFIDLVGPLTTPQVKFVQSAGASIQVVSTVSYPTIAAGTTVTIDIENFIAKETTGGSTTTTSGKVTSTLSPRWATMGRNIAGQVPRVMYTGAGVGTVTLRYSPAYH